jgi:hypothetical protein
MLKFNKKRNYLIVILFGSIVNGLRSQLTIFLSNGIKGSNQRQINLSNILQKVLKNDTFRKILL